MNIGRRFESSDRDLVKQQDRCRVGRGPELWL